MLSARRFDEIQEANVARVGRRADQNMRLKQRILSLEAQLAEVTAQRDAYELLYEACKGETK